MRQPKVFLFDEPLSNLDAKLRGDMRREIARIHPESKATSMYVTHDQIEAMTLADMIVVLKDGVVQQIGTPVEIYERPANRFVAGFFGTPTMNFLTADLAQTGEKQAARGPGFEIPLAARAGAAPRASRGRSHRRRHASRAAVARSARARHRALGRGRDARGARREFWWRVESRSVPLSDRGNGSVALQWSRWTTPRTERRFISDYAEFLPMARDHVRLHTHAGVEFIYSLKGG